MRRSLFVRKFITFTLLFAIPLASVHTFRAQTQDETSCSTEDAERLMADPQSVNQFKNYVVSGLLQAILSKVESVRLVIGNNTIKLNPAEKTKTMDNLASIRTALADNVNALLGSDEHPISDQESLVNSLLFCRHLIAYLNTAIEHDFKKMDRFTFSLEEKQDLQPNEIIALFDEVCLGFKKLENSFKYIGATKQAKITKKFYELVDRHGPKVKVGAIVFFAALLSRYALKKQPKEPAASRGDLSDLPSTPTCGLRDNSAPQASAPDSDESDTTQRDERTSWFSSARSKAQDAFTWSQDTKFAYGMRWLDDNIIGTRPVFNSILGNSIEKHGTGLFGHIHENFFQLITVINFPAILAKKIDEITSGINSWKGLYSNPDTFFKVDELFKNKQQKISAIDEFFLSSAIEHSLPRLIFDDIAGLEEQKKALEPVINYLLNPDLFDKTGTSIEKGYLLYGPSRTGKTYLAEALAGELVLKHKRKLSFIKIRGSELNMIGIKKVLDMVSKYAPCIVFIDEIDLLNLQRDHNTTLLDQFLTGMKHDAGNHQVIFLAATNRIDHIDQALLQPGRFGKIIPFENPSRKDRKNFFEQHLARKNIYDPELLDINRLVQETEGCTFGDLASITNDALAAATQKREMLSYRHFDLSIDSFKHKIAETEISIPEEERALIAAHLAGHALTYQLLATGEMLHKVTMLPIQKKITEQNIWLSSHEANKKVTNYGEVLTLHKPDTSGLDTFEQKTNRIKALLAGHAAEKVIHGSCSYCYHADDYEHAHQLAESIVMRGLKKEHLSRDAADKKMDEIMTMLSTCEAEVTTLLEANKDKLEKVMNELNKHITLTAADVALITKN